MTVACLAAVAPLSAAMAQGVTLPSVTVETKQAKKKSTAAPKKSSPTAPQQPAPEASGPLPQPPDSYKADTSASPKMTAALLDTPQTVTVLPGTIIQERGATNLTEALRNTPGITFSAGENGFTASPNNFQLRGFDTSGSVFVDGFRDSGSYARDMFNIDRVEVVKGPAADNGRGTAGGYINIITKTPVMENFVKGETSLGFDEYSSEVRKRATVDVNQRAGTTAVRLNGMIEDGGVAGREIAEANAWGLAPSITFGMGTKFRTTLSYEHLERHDLPDWGVPAASVKGIFRYDPAAGAAARDTFYGLKSDFDDVRSDAVQARFEYDLSPNFTVSNTTRWSSTDRQARFTFPHSFDTATDTVRTDTAFYDRTNTALANHTNLSGKFYTGPFRHSISTGIELSHEQSAAFGQAPIASVGAPVDVLDPDPNRAGGAAFDPTERNKVKVDTAAAYLFDTIDITRQLKLTGGVRVEHYNVSISNKDISPPITALIGDGYETSHTTLGGKIGLAYKPVPAGTLYASYGISHLPPGSFLSNPDISRSGTNVLPGFVPNADPVEMTNYEVGAKWDFFGGRLSTTAALFHTVKRVGYTGEAGDPPVVYGDQIVEGLELGIAGNLTERWKMFGGLLLLNSRRDHGAAVDRAGNSSGDYGTGGGSDPDWVASTGGVTTTDGDELAFTPNFSATLWTTFDLTEKFTIGGGVQYVGESWFGRPDDANRLIPNGKYGKLPDYFLVNLMAAYEINNNVAVVFNVDNVFDEKYAVTSNWPAQRALLGAPRTYRIGTSFKY